MYGHCVCTVIVKCKTLGNIVIIFNISLIALSKSMFFSALMTFCWSFMQNVPKQHIWKCMVITVLGYGLRNALLQLKMNLILVTFISAFLTAFLAIYWAKRYLITPKAVLVPALLCMMPGITAYKAMISLVYLGFYGYDVQTFAQMMNFAFNALFVTLALVFGLSLPAVIFYRKEPII